MNTETPDPRRFSDMQSCDLSELRTLVRKVCGSPLLVGGCFVPIYADEYRLGYRTSVATYEEMLLAVECRVKLLDTANCYLRTQLPSTGKET